jgi:hypothetical protein
MRSPAALLRVAPAAAAVAALATACSASPGTADAQRTAQDALRAASSQDTVALCALLSPATAHQLELQESTPCATATRSVQLGDAADAGPAQVWGSSALVPTGATSVFLTEVNGRWRVRAAGCSLREDQPADCELGGG